MCVVGHLYYLVLLSWTPLLGLFVVIYLATVVAFAVLFGLCEGCVPLQLGLLVQ